MIYNPTLHVSEDAQAVSSSGAAVHHADDAGFNFTTILCVAWSTCGRNIVFGTPDGVMIFSTEQALAHSIATNAPPTADAREVKPENGCQRPSSVVAPMAASREEVSGEESLGCDPHRAHDGDAEEAESLRSMSPLSPWTDDAREVRWGVATHRCHHRFASGELEGDGESSDPDNTSDAGATRRDSKKDKNDGEADSEDLDYLIHDPKPQDQSGIREVCRRLIEGGVGAIALCGQSSIMALAGAASPSSLHAARTVKVVDVSQPYTAHASSPPAALHSESGPAVAPDTGKQPPATSALGEEANEAIEEDPVDRVLGYTGALDPDMDTVGASFPSSDLARLVLQERLVRAACQAASTGTTVAADVAPSSSPEQPSATTPGGTQPVIFDLDAAVAALCSPQAAHTSTTQAIDAVTAEAVASFRRQHGPAIVCEQTFSFAVGALCLTPHYLLVAQTGPANAPEQSCLYVYNRKWKQCLCLYFFPSSEPRFVKDCFAVASTWSPSRTPHFAATSSHCAPAHGLRYHHAVLPGEKRGEVRVLGFHKSIKVEEAGTDGVFSVDQIQAFTSTPIRAVAMTADGTRAVVTSEEGKRIKLLQICGGKFELQFFSLDRGLTHAVNESVSLHIVNIPDWRAATTTATTATSTASATRYALVAMITTTGTVHVYLVDVAHHVQWKCLGVETRLRLVHDELGVSLRFPEPTTSLDKTMLLVLQYPDGAVPHARGESRVDAAAAMPTPAAHAYASSPQLPPPLRSADASLAGAAASVPLGATARIWRPFRMASYHVGFSHITRAEQSPIVRSMSLMQSASRWLKRDVAGSKSSGVVPSKAEGGIACQFSAYLPFL